MFCPTIAVVNLCAASITRLVWTLFSPLHKPYDEVEMIKSKRKRITLVSSSVKEANILYKMMTFSNNMIRKTTLRSWYSSIRLSVFPLLLLTIPVFPSIRITVSLYILHVWCQPIRSCMSLFVSRAKRAKLDSSFQQLDLISLSLLIVSKFNI